MSNNIKIKGLVYQTENGRVVVEYGLKDLYSTSNNSFINTIIIDDQSLCPPLYEKIEFKENVDYKAKVESIDETHKKVKIIVKQEVGFIQFKHLANYFGSVDCIKKTYKKGDEIDVNFLPIENSPKTFVEKGARDYPFTSFSYIEGDEVSMHIGPSDEKRLLVWFNGVYFEIHPKYDDIFRCRMLSGIYYPGYPINAKVTKVVDKGKAKFYGFSVIHERIDYGLDVGEYDCTICELLGIKYAHFTTDKGDFYSRIPKDEMIAHSPLILTGKFNTRIRIIGFNELGEPIIQFRTVINELYEHFEGQSFDIKIVRPDDPKSNMRFWTGPDGLCGTIPKLLLNSIEDLECGIEGHIIDGDLHINKKGTVLHQLKVGDIEKAYIIEKNPMCWKGTISKKPVYIFSSVNVNDSSNLIDIRVVYVDNSIGLILCVPINVSSYKEITHNIGSTISMQMVEKTDSRILFSNAVSYGVMDINDWDWSKGKSLDEFECNNVCINTLIKDVTSEGVLILDRHNLLENPWNIMENMKGQTVEAIIKDINTHNIVISVNGIITEVNWNLLTPYHMTYAKYMVEIGSKVNLVVNEVDPIKRRLYFINENLDDIHIDFNTESNYSATVVKLIPSGILISVNGIYGVISNKKMLSDKQYTPGESINVRYLSHAIWEQSYNIKFSHIDAIDISDTIKKGKTIPSAKVIDIDNGVIKFAYNGISLFCEKRLAKYFSLERDEYFGNTINVGQVFNLRVVDEQYRKVVPEHMPDYSEFPIGAVYEAKIEEIFDEGYLIYIDALKDKFRVPFKGFCDWGPVHFETRKKGDIVNVTHRFCLEPYNTPIFSMLANIDDPWKTLRAGDSIKVRTLGSKLKEKDFYVDVNGIPVRLSVHAICCLLEMPWMEKKIDYSIIKKLEEIQEFEMDILAIDTKHHTISLMPHISKPPTIVKNAQVINNTNCVWVKCENNIIGRIEKSEFPKGYKVDTIVNQAVCKSFDRNKGYAHLSVKALFEIQNEKTEEESDSYELQGISVTEGMEVHKDQIVRGVLRNVNKNLKRIHISVGPYMGIITYRELSNMFCDAPEYMFKKGKEYDFYVTEVDTNRNNLLYLSRRTFLPLPPQSVTIGEMVHAKVCRFNPENMLIIAEVEEFGGAEAVIHASDLAGCKIRNKTRYPKIGFHFKAHVESVSKLPSGEINRIKLNRGV